jgi:hypothetical protein
MGETERQSEGERQREADLQFGSGLDDVRGRQSV